jgi:secreted PhoX family phosphatase
LGGTTTILYDTKTQTVERIHLSLAGTLRNCAGGLTPWGSWITCEESVQIREGDFEQDHGYNFEVPATATELCRAVPLKAMGRFNHEAVAVDARSGVVYQTEDRGDGLIYRFVPNTRKNLRAGGKLQALKARDKPSLDTRNWRRTAVRPGEKLAVEWVDLEDVESPNDELRAWGFFKHGAARFARGEGMWYGRRTIYWCCTNGGKKQKGQIWKYTPSEHEGLPEEHQSPGVLELFVEPTDGNIAENGDNLTVAPWGDIFVCEDNGRKEKRLLRVTPERKIFEFARNIFNSSELAGVTFSPDGSTLFVNIQHPGTTLAITGPWETLYKDPLSMG